jgi:hypothetical protein
MAMSISKIISVIKKVARTTFRMRMTMKVVMQKISSLNKMRTKDINQSEMLVIAH